MKLCKDCKYFVQVMVLDRANSGATCHHNHSLQYDDPVFGNHSLRSCIEMRKGSTLCGMSAKFWIPAADFVANDYGRIK